MNPILDLCANRRCNHPRFLHHVESDFIAAASVASVGVRVKKGGQEK
jgi:hypothetical protein